MTVVRWDPFRDLLTVREAVNRLFEEGVGRSPAGTMPLAGAPPVDMYETPDEVVVTAALPGVTPDDVDITIQGDNLTIKGEFKNAVEAPKASYLLAERRYGTFTRVLTVPVGVEADGASAQFKDGVLMLRLPKTEGVKPKTIRVKSK